MRKCNQGAAGAAGGAATATTNSNMATQEVAADGHGVVEVEPHHQFSYASTARLEPVRLSTEGPAGSSGVQRGPRGTDGERCVKWRSLLINATKKKKKNAPPGRSEECPKYLLKDKKQQLQILPASQILSPGSI